MVTRTPLSRIKLTMYPLWTTFICFVWRTQQAFVILAVLIFIDYILWIIRAKNTSEKITSKKMRIWLLWKLLLLLVPLSIWLCLKGAGIESMWLVTISASTLLLSELFSIIQHIYILSTWDIVEEYDAISFVFKKLLKVIKNMLEKVV